MSATSVDAPSGLRLNLETLMVDEIKANYGFRKNIERYFELEGFKKKRKSADSCETYKAFVQAGYQQSTSGSNEVLRSVQ